MLKTNRLEAVNRLALKYFIDSFRRSDKAQEYVYSRISKKTADKFYVGYAPANTDKFIEYLNQNKVSTSSVKALGLVVFDLDNNAYAQFSNRIMLPVIHAGRVLGFGGRTIVNNKLKYINSKASILYNKSEVLYGLWKTRKSIWKSGHCFLVEGYFDVLGLYNLGLTNCAASCGTAFTQDHAQLLHRYTKQVYILYDGDDAGKAAAVRAKKVLKSVGIYKGTVTLPEGMDPDVFIAKHGKSAVYKLKVKK